MGVVLLGEDVITLRGRVVDKAFLVNECKAEVSLVNRRLHGLGQSASALAKGQRSCQLLYISLLSVGRCYWNVSKCKGRALVKGQGRLRVLQISLLDWGQCYWNGLERYRCLGLEID